MTECDLKIKIILDLSVSFDTIDYSVLLDRLSGLYGILGTALTSIHSFLINRCQSIKIRNCFSKASNHHKLDVMLVLRTFDIDFNFRKHILLLLLPYS